MLGVFCLLKRALNDLLRFMIPLLSMKWFEKTLEENDHYKFLILKTVLAFILFSDIQWFKRPEY